MFPFLFVLAAVVCFVAATVARRYSMSLVALGLALLALPQLVAVWPAGTP